MQQPRTTSEAQARYAMLWREVGSYAARLYRTRERLLPDSAWHERMALAESVDSSYLYGGPR